MSDAKFIYCLEPSPGAPPSARLLLLLLLPALARRAPPRPHLCAPLLR